MRIRELLNQYKSKMALNLLASLLDTSSISLKTLYLDNNIDEEIYKIFINNIDLVENGYPIEYVTNKAYFYGLRLYVNSNCLIPRDETEELVNWFLNDNKNRHNLRVVDMCCGSGCIGLAIKDKRNDYLVSGIDVSKEAIRIARKNSLDLKLDISYYESDLFNNFSQEFDILISNPPYISKDDKEIADEVKKYEPSKALFTNDKLGIEFYERIFDYLNNHNFIEAYFEFGYKQKEYLIKLLDKYNFVYEFRKDINNHDRMLKIRKTSR